MIQLERVLEKARARTETDLRRIHDQDIACSGLKYNLTQVQKDLAAALASSATNGSHSGSGVAPAGETREQRIARETGENAVVRIIPARVRFDVD